MIPARRIYGVHFQLLKKDLTDIDLHERAFDEAMMEGRQKPEGSPAGEAAPRTSALEKFRIR